MQNNGGVTSKWDARARLGVNLGLSPCHSRSVSLVLNLGMGLVSPQFHIKDDEFFETVKPNSVNDHVISRWQYISGVKKIVKVRRVKMGSINKSDPNFKL